MNNLFTSFIVFLNESKNHLSVALSLTVHGVDEAGHFISMSPLLVTCLPVSLWEHRLNIHCV
jgi:hypothetical protein